MSNGRPFPIPSKFAISLVEKKINVMAQEDNKEEIKRNFRSDRLEGKK